MRVMRPVSAEGTRILVGGLRQMHMDAAAAYVEQLAVERGELLEKLQNAIDHSRVVAHGTLEGTLERGVFVEGQIFSDLQELVASLEEPAPNRPHLTVHTGGGPPARPTKRHVTIPEGDPA